ncbi:metal ABC transporter ATP-binding protein [Corynebacterium sp. ZY180755]
MADVPALTLTDVSVSYGDVRACEGISFSVPQGVVAGLVGPNGAGKSTVLKAAVDLVAHSGQVEFFGQPLDRVRKRVGYMPQSAEVDWDYPITVEQVVAMGRYPALGWFKRMGARDRAVVTEALDHVGLVDVAKRQISELSGGQRRRVFVARILAQEPDLYLMDEPFAGVDVASEHVIHHVLKKLRKAGKTVVMVHHDLSTVSKLCDEVSIINRSVVSTGPTKESFTKENVKQAFGLGLL